MKLKVTALFALLLVGCAKPVPIKMEFPPIPEVLQKKCEELKTVTPGANGTPITELFKVVVENYMLYHECSNKVEGWNEWYSQMKSIYDKVGK